MDRKFDSYPVEVDRGFVGLLVLCVGAVAVVELVSCASDPRSGVR